MRLRHSARFGWDNAAVGPHRALSPDLTDSVLRRWQLPVPAPSLEGLEAVYHAWCLRVPFDNLQKRISLEEGHGHLTGREPAEFFERYLVDGTGGTCWPTSHALAALLEALGFSVRRIIAAMNFERLGYIAPNHGSVVATVDGRDWLVDTTIRSGRPLQLRPDAGAVEDPAHPVRADLRGDAWLVRWSSTLPATGGEAGAEVPCLLLEDGVPPERFPAAYEATRSVPGPFNSFLVAVRNLPDGGVLAVRGDTVYRRRPSGEITARRVVRERERVLLEEFGFSAAIVARLPADVFRGAEKSR